MLDWEIRELVLPILKEIAANGAAANGKLDTIIAHIPTEDANAATIIGLLKRILGALVPQISATLIVTDLTTKQTVEGVNVMSNPIKDDSLGVQYTVNWGKDAAGNPATPPPMPSIPVWSDPTGLTTLTPAADGMSCAAKPAGGLGTATPQVAIPASTDGVYAGGTLTDSLPIVAEESTSAPTLS